MAIEKINSQHLVFYYLYLFRLFAKPESQIVDEFTRLELICSFLIQADKVIFTTPSRLFLFGKLIYSQNQVFTKVEGNQKSYLMEK